jgi:hypothetical protein
MKTTLVLAGSLLILCAANTACIGQDLVIYPADGQSQEQLDKDKYECYTWAKQQTGFDPMVQSSASTTTQQSSQGGLVRGGARGALVGVAAGAIAGDAGKGAGIGATVGALGGAMKQKDQQRQQNQAAEQKAATYGKNREGYTRAQSACLEGRGYSVK